MRFWIVSAFLISSVLCLARDGGWRPIPVYTRTALGAYNRVSREYEGRLRMERLLLAYHRSSPVDDVRIIFDAQSVRFGLPLRCTANVRRSGYPWPIWYLQCYVRGPAYGKRRRGGEGMMF